MFLPFDHVAFVSQWSMCTRNEQYTEIVLCIEFAVTNGLNTLWTKPQNIVSTVSCFIHSSLSVPRAFSFVFVTEHEYSKAWEKKRIQLIKGIDKYWSEGWINRGLWLESIVHKKICHALLSFSCRLTLLLLSSKCRDAQPSRSKCMSVVMIIYSLVRFHWSKVSKAKFSILCDIFLVRNWSLSWEFRSCPFCPF